MKSHKRKADEYDKQAEKAEQLGNAITAKHYRKQAKYNRRKAKKEK